MASSTTAAGAAQSYTYTRPSGLDTRPSGLDTRPSGLDAGPSGPGAALGRLVALGRVPLSRTLKALTSAADAGAHAGVWTILAAALPHVLPEPGGRAPAGLPSMITLAARLAEITGARGAIPDVADVAARGGSSRLVKESARLHRTLTAT
ncbi:hypothetical protein [Actinomadura latina]|uniref:Uncharacterized protein n=1 Tax=Actinomadura latina TaxID=163603 RepID=A0A846Z837_9ACTN|nr:hypothetical protein [Actinomadura latina]NKZ08541.1 hypothetical protein [Actinomadura latina]